MHASICPCQLLDTVVLKFRNILLPNTQIITDYVQVTFAKMKPASFHAFFV